MNQRIAGLALAVVGMTVVSIMFLPAIADGLGNQAKQKGVTYCDITGNVAGKAQDFNFGKQVVDWNMQLFTKSNSCEVADGGLGDLFNFSFVSRTVPQAALLTPGEVTIYVKVFDAENDLVSSKDFKVSTGIGELEKSFDEPLLFKNLEKGASYTVKVYTSWAGSSVQTQKSITV